MRGRRAGLRQVERHVFRLANFHIDRGHHYATSDLAGDPHAAALYLTRPPDVQPDIWAGQSMFVAYMERDSMEGAKDPDETGPDPRAGEQAGDR